MPFCSKCGKELTETDKFCPNCGYPIAGIGEEARAPRPPTPPPPSPPPPPPAEVQKTDAMSALQRGVNIISTKPLVLAPALIGAVISAILSTIATFWFMPLGFWWLGGLFAPRLLALVAIGILLMLIGGIIAYILNFVSLDMSRDAYLNQALDMGKSIRYVLGRLLTFIVASIVGAILMITIILIPVAILMFVIVVVDETGIGSAVSTALRVFRERLSDIVILAIISIVAGFILGLIPVIGPILAAVVNVIVGLAFIHIYINYKMTKTP